MISAAALLSLTLVTAPLLAFAPTKSGSEPLAPELELRVQALGKELRCATCQGMSIADSPASMARSQLDKVRELVTEGKSDDEIKQYFVARYGEWVLLSPPKAGWNLLVWLGPAALILVGGGVIATQLRHKARRSAKGQAARGAGSAGATVAAGSTGASGPEIEDDYLRAVRQELER